jgi:hypothetical protein
MITATVITADIVNSTSLQKTALSGLIKSFKAILKDYKFEYYRGDSFQVYLKDSTIALELCLQLRLTAKKLLTSDHRDIDIRTAVGIGKVEGPVRSLQVTLEEPFILSGRALDELSISKDRLRIVSAHENANDIFIIIARFIDYIFEDLTAKQAAVILELMRGQTQIQAAKKLKKSQVTINRSAHAAGWPAIYDLMENYKNAIAKYII